MASRSASKSPKLWWDFRYIWMFISTIWVFVLVGGVIGIWQDRWEPAIHALQPGLWITTPVWARWLATILVFSFIAIYVETMYRMYFGRSNWKPDISRRERWTIRLPLTVIATALVALPYEDVRKDWPFVFVFVVISWTLTAGPDSAFSAVVISTAGSALILSLAYDPGVMLDVSLYSLAFGFFTSGYVINRGLINELRLEQSRERDQAVTEERFRLARDLHDTVGHSMTQITLKVELARRLVATDTARAERELQDVERISRSLSAQVRKSITGDLRLSLEQEIHRATDLLSSLQITPIIDTRFTGIPEAMADVLAWCVREGVMNVIKHSGATECTVRIGRDRGDYSLVIDDNGPNLIVANPAGQGINGMRQRVGEAGGTVRLDSGKRGHILEIRIPG